MPKETFLKLSKEKQQKVINAAKKEFARAPIENVSIKAKTNERMDAIGRGEGIAVHCVSLLKKINE